MGTDIHCVVEERVAPGHWVTVRVLASFVDETGSECRPTALARNYRRFAALAGVRGSGPAPRGSPTDASDSARHLLGSCGGRSPSWLPLDEATAVLAATDPGLRPELQADLQRGEKDSGHNWYYFSEIGEGDDYRLIYWFDS